MLEVRNLSSCYGKVRALEDVSVTIASGEIVALVGSNGAGKSTFLKCLSGVQPVNGGSIVFDGDDVTHRDAARRLSAGIAQSPEGRQIFGPLSVEENLRMGCLLRREQVQEGLQFAYDLFPVLYERRGDRAGVLSGGQQQMVAIARALMSKPKLLLLDEPSLGLAPVLVDQILGVIVALKREGTTILLVEQNAAAALEIADRGYVMKTGAIALSGRSADLRSDEEVRRSYLGH